jgi:ABC-type antimicrobial peptide transport system permease subunit
VLSYHVARQRREIGIRLALGAGRGRILRMVFRLGGWLVGLGVVIGVGASLALSRYVTSQVFTVPELNVTAMVVAVVILLGVAALACLVPAYRATRVEPLRVLRSD